MSEAPPSAASTAVLDQVFETADFGMAIWDLDLQIVRVNDALAQMNGRAARDHVGRTLAELLPETAAPVERALRELARGVGPSRRRVQVAAPGESGRRFQYRLHQLREGEALVGMWGAIVEVTEQHRAHEAGRRLAGELRDEHRINSQLKVSLMPDVLPQIPGADVASTFHPAGDGDQVGGDFYDVFRVGSPQSWLVVVGDVCGKGVEAASLTALARYTLRAAAIRAGAKPAALLAELNEAIRRQRRDLRYLTAVCAFLEPDADGLLLHTCVAGHPPPLKVTAGGEVEVIGPQGALIGVFESPRLSEATVRLGPGEQLVLYTDGVTEAGAPETELGEAGLIEVLSGLDPGTGAGETVATVERAIGVDNSAPSRDDVAMLVVRAEPDAD